MLAAEQIYSDATVERTSSGVSWSAIFAGAAAAAALSLILLVLGIGLGFSAISPWPNSGLGATAIGVSSIAWLILTQIVAAGIGGYLAGRLRTKWITVHSDEVYFRDTSHGFLAWAVASLVVAVLIGGILGKTMSAGVSASAMLTTAAIGTAGGVGAASAERNPSSTASGASSEAGGSGDGAMKYLVDSLFRPAASATDNTPDSDTATRVEASRIFVNSLHSDGLPAQDRQYLALVIAKRTGLSPADAEKRVTDTFTIIRTTVADAEERARQAAENARKTAAYAALWMFVSLLSGAFIASLCATFGGKQRDKVVHVAFPA